MTDDLRTRIGNALVEASIFHGCDDSDEGAVVIEGYLSTLDKAVLAALPAADSDEVAEVIGLAQLDHVAAGPLGSRELADVLLSRYHMIPKGTA